MHPNYYHLQDRNNPDIQRVVMAKPKRVSPQARQSMILDILQKEGSVDVAGLSLRFGVSEMSIRNDLNTLGSQGKLVRKHGGAESSPLVSTERPLTEKQKENYKQKNAICRTATTLLSNGMSVILDAGTTNEHIVKYLNDISQLTVITNGINVMTGFLERPDLQVYTVGGRVDPRSYSVLGESAVEGLRQYSAQMSFITADGVSLSHGVTNNSQEATNMSRVIIANSVNHVLLADSSKVGRIGAFPLCQWSDIDMWVTDNEVEEEIVAEVESLGVHVLIATDTDM